jgi:hypothetical protein
VECYPRIFFAGVVYHADQDTDNVYELYSVPLDGSDSPVKLNSSLSGGEDVQHGFQISPASRRVVYRADQDVDEVIEPYASTGLDGGSYTIFLPLILREP